MNNIFTWIKAIHRLDLEAKKKPHAKNASCFNHSLQKQRRTEEVKPANMPTEYGHLNNLLSIRL